MTPTDIEKLKELSAEMRELALEKQQVAWGRKDGGQEWTIAATTATRCADGLDSLIAALEAAQGDNAMLLRCETEATKAKDEMFAALEAKDAEIAEWKRQVQMTFAERSARLEAEAALKEAREGLEGLSNAIAALGEREGSKALFEASVIQSAEAMAAWRMLDLAQKQAHALLSKQDSGERS